MNLPPNLTPHLSLPKVELHLHLDCSLSYRAVRALSPSVSLEEFQARFIAPAKCVNLVEFLDCVGPSLDLLQTEAALRLSVADLFDQLAADHVCYAEIRFAPLLHLAGGLKAEFIIETILDQVALQSQKKDIAAGVILCTMRHFTMDQSLETARLVAKYADQGVVALDLAGDEAGFSLKAHRAAFDKINALGLPTIAHAGEACGPKSVMETLKVLKPQRLGHGVRSIEDPEALNLLLENNIHLEVCPTCNVQIGIFTTLADHPIDMLLQQGLSVNINTDTRTVTNTTLTKEYDLLAKTFDWDSHQFLATNLNGLTAAFIPDDLRHRLKEKLIAAYGSPI